MRKTTFLGLGLLLGFAALAPPACGIGQHGHRDPHARHSSHDDSSSGARHTTEQRAAAGKGRANFPTVGFEERHEVMVPFPSEEVCPLFEPEGRHLIYDWWAPTTVREAKGETLEGLVTVSRPHQSASPEIFLFVTEHDPQRGYLQYLVLWGDFELQRIDITCARGETERSTNVVWTERNAGIHENGVSMVTAFVEGGKLRDVVERYAQRAEEYLRNRREEP